MRIPLSTLAVTITLAWSAACGDNADPDVRGEHHVYVMSHQSIPLSNTDARDLGMDINGDGVVDNQMGYLLSTLHSYGIDSQELTDRLIDRGSLIQLIDVQIPRPDDGPAAAGFATAVGRNPRPAPCETAEDLVCRGHLQGDAIFDIDPGFVRGAPIPASREGNAWVGRGPTVSVMTGFFDAPVPIDLMHVHLLFEETSGSLTGKIAGGVSKDDVSSLIASAASLANEVVRRDCLALDSPPTCGCKADTNGKTLVALFDSGRDCFVSRDEVEKSAIALTLASPDIRLDGVDYLSFGFVFDAASAAIDEGH